MKPEAAGLYRGEVGCGVRTLRPACGCASPANVEKLDRAA